MLAVAKRPLIIGRAVYGDARPAVVAARGSWCSSGFWRGDIHMSIASVDRHAGRSIKPLDLVFLLSNAMGILLYLRLASRGWRIPREHGAVPVTGEPFVWALALPVLGGFLLADIVWGGLLLRHGQWKRGLWWLITAGLWGIALWVDFAHH
jgi:hypothetical protein